MAAHSTTKKLHGRVCDVRSLILGLRRDFEALRRSLPETVVSDDRLGEMNAWMIACLGPVQGDERSRSAWTMDDYRILRRQAWNRELKERKCGA